jgi:hypothetical protein
VLLWLTDIVSMLELKPDSVIEPNPVSSDVPLSNDQLKSSGLPELTIAAMLAVGRLMSPAMAKARPDFLNSGVRIPTFLP